MTTLEVCQSLRNSLPSLYKYAVEPQGGVRVQTPLFYPDGGVVDVSVVEDASGFFVTDHGDALGWLRMQSASSELSPNQRDLLCDIGATLGVKLECGRLIMRSEDSQALGEAVELVAQAALRIADISYTFRTRNAESIADDVDDWLRDRRLSYQRAVRRRGSSGREWTVDYEIEGDSRLAIVFLLSSGSRDGARRATEHVFTGCADLRAFVESEGASQVALFDDTADVWGDEDLKLMQDVSRAVMWSRPDEFERVLRS